MCAHADYREGFRACAAALRETWTRLTGRLRTWRPLPPRIEARPVPVVAATPRRPVRRR